MGIKKIAIGLGIIVAIAVIGTAVSQSIVRSRAEKRMNELRAMQESYQASRYGGSEARDQRVDIERVNENSSTLVYIWIPRIIKMVVGGIILAAALLALRFSYRKAKLRHQRQLE